jgi:colicin import membrane protein
VTYNGALEDEARIKGRLDELNGIIIGQESELAAQQQARADALKAEQEAQRKAEEAKRKAEADAKSRAEMNRKLDRELALAKIEDDRKRAKKELEYQQSDDIAKANAVGAGAATINKIREKYALELREMQAGWRAEDEAELKKETEARNAFWEDYWKRENEMFMSERQLAEQRLMEELEDEKARVDTLGLSKQAADEAKLEIEQQFQIRLAQLRDKYAEEDLAAEKEATAKYNETFLADKEKRLLEVQKEYDELKAIAEKYGLDTIELEKWRAERIKEIEKGALEETRKDADAKFQAISGFADEVGGILSQLGDMAEEGSKRQRRLAIAEVLLSQAQAMASAVKGASEAAASTGPGAPFVLAGYIASMLGTILGTFASIKNIVGASGGDSTVTAQTRPIQQAMIPNVAQPNNPQFNIGPVQAYVVESQMQAQLNMTAGVARRARL